MVSSEERAAWSQYSSADSCSSKTLLDPSEAGSCSSEPECQGTPCGLSSAVLVPTFWVAVPSHTASHLTWLFGLVKCPPPCWTFSAAVSRWSESPGTAWSPFLSASAHSSSESPSAPTACCAEFGRTLPWCQTAATLKSQRATCLSSTQSSCRLSLFFHNSNVSCLWRVDQVNLSPVALYLSYLPLTF